MWGISSCTDVSVETRSYPVIDTNAVTEINESGAIFNAEILDLGTEGIAVHGFVYDDSPGPLLERSDRITLGESVQKGTYSVLANSNLIDGKTYYVKAFAISKGVGITVYGQEISFVSKGGSAPKIENFTPLHGAIGDTVIISGSGFSTVPFNNEVSFGAVGAPIVKSKKDSIWCIVPLYSKPGENQLSVKLGQFKVEAETKFVLNALSLTSLIPNPVSFGDTLTIIGNNFPLQKGFVKVTLLSKEALIYTLMPTVLKVIVPNEVTLHKSILKVIAGEQIISFPDSIKLLSPVIDNFSPQKGTKGTEVTIQGNYFSPIKENNKVEINGKVCAIREASKKSIVAIIPSGIVPGEYPISITVANQNNISVGNFEIIQPSISNVSPLNGTWGTSVTITGVNFGSSVTDNIVKFNNVEATVVSASSTTLQVKVPNNLLNMSSVVTVKVSSVDNLSDTFGTPFDLDPPSITSFSPGSGKSGSQITIQGENFNPMVIHQIVKFGDYEASVLNATSTQLVVQLPPSLEDSNVNIQIDVAEQVATSGSTFHLISPWRRLASFPGTARDNAIAFAFNTQGYLGLGNEPVTFTKRIWKYDPSTDIWSDHVTFNFPSIGAGAPFLNMIAFTDNTNAFVGLGTLGTSLNSRMRSYDPNLNSWVSVNPIGNIESQYSTDGAVAYGINGKGYVTTGKESGNSLSLKMWEYDPGTDLWSRKADFPGSARMEASGFSIGDKAYLVSGRGYPSYVLHNDLWAYDVTLNNWNQLTSLPGSARWQSTAFSINGTGYLVGGGATNSDIYYNLLNDVWMYNPISNSWSQLEDFPGKPRAGATVFVIDNKAYFGTGRSNPGGLLNDFWEFDPSKL
ncbi:MAG: IPT/TIG domain-containing protein [Cyclobacteriaceae bacterium]